ncbi:MAG TPA: hypothetical protein VH092_26045 [Urbifossiella sp.]|jgi:hypothetical protein|nr:hypothetical protein [Urbifossiella sp.]
MKLRFFVVDDCGQLRKARQTAIRSLLAGRVGAEVFQTGDTRELKLVSVVCDDALLPRRISLLRMPLTDGRFTDGDELVLRAFARPDCVTPDEAVRHHLTGWPRDLIRQMAVALDVPAAGLDALLDVGGPVLAAAVSGLSLRRAAEGMD